MTIMQQIDSEDKHALLNQLEGLWTQVETAAREGTAAHELERNLFDGVLKLGYGLLGYFFRLMGDGDQGPELTLADGRVLRRLEPVANRRYLSVFGEYKLNRRVYGTRVGQRHECIPLDTRLQLPEAVCSYLLQDWSQALVVEMAHQPAQQLLKKFLGVTVPVSMLERLNQTMAQSVESYWQSQTLSVAPEGEFVVISGDGKGVPMRKPAHSAAIESHAHKSGPKPDRKKMAIVGAAYDGQAYPRSAEQVCQALFRRPDEPQAANDEAYTPRPTPINKVVRASLTTVDQGETILARETVFTWLGEQVQQRDPNQTKPVVVVMDGQHCLWDDARQVLGERERVEILDLLHATSKLWDLVHVFHPPGSAYEFDVMKLFTQLLLTGQVGHVIIWFRYCAAVHSLQGNDLKRVEDGCRYFENHQHRMRYDQYLAAGYPIASGVIEGACRHVVKDRLERSGMHWTIPGAQAMLKLRCVAINEQWEDFMTFRIQQQTQHLYPYAEQFQAAQWPLSIAA